MLTLFPQPELDPFGPLSPEGSLDLTATVESAEDAVDPVVDPALEDVVPTTGLSLLGGGSSGTMLTLPGPDADLGGFDAADDLNLADLMAAVKNAETPVASAPEAAGSTADMIGFMLARQFGADMTAPEAEKDSFNLDGLTTEASEAPAKALDPFLDTIDDRWHGDLAMFIEPADAVLSGLADAPLGDADHASPLVADLDLSPNLGDTPDGWVV